MPRLTPLILFFALPSIADEGEAYVDASLGTDVAWLSNPAVGDAASSPFTDTSSFTILPRGAVALRFGLTNELHLGVGLEGAAIGNVLAKGVSSGAASGDLFAGTYAEMGAPLSATWRLDSGGDFTGLVELTAGPMLTVWAKNALADPTNIDANGLPSRLPIDIADQWNPGAFARVSAAVEARLFDVLVLALAPHAGVSWAGTPGVHAGIILRPSLVFGGPT